MNQNLPTIRPDIAQAAQAREWLMRLPQLPLDDLPAMAEVEATVAALSEPAESTWLMARVAALLSPYFEKDTPRAVREMEAEDWLEALGEYPQWAIEGAVRWWKSAENPDRRKRPLEGDIEARCRYAMRDFQAVPDILRRKISPPQPWEAPKQDRPRVTREAAAEILAKAGFVPKSMRP